ncbi:putative uncharacterized protein C7orf78 [Amphiura filiformis]|uniref:putative uncharacterized protein C7orf78 n=1 Tax=Amphiura filiformis TaxID=82378 RepID=UPI003B21BCAE
MTAAMVQLSSMTPNSTTTSARSKFPPLRTASSCNTNYAEKEFSFPGKSKFKAGQDLLLTRSDSYTIRKPHQEDDIWRRPPPNFCPQSYAAKPPKRNSQESMKPWKYGTYPGHYKNRMKKEKVVSLPKALQPERPKSTKLVNRFKILDSFEAKCLFVSEGMHQKEKYANPKQHDFRQYPPLGPLGLPEFDTSDNHDPYNINFKSNNLDTIHGMRPVTPGHRFKGRQMGQAMESQVTYEPDLILPKGKWPLPGEEFTRHRQRNRSPHAALLGRIEDTLNEQWAQEKAEKERRQKEKEQQEKERKFHEDIQRKLEAHEAQEWRRTGPGGWSARSSQYQGRDRTRAKEELSDSSGSSTLQTLSDGSSDFS